MSSYAKFKCPECGHEWWEHLGGWGLFPDGIITCPKCKRKVRPVTIDEDRSY